MSLLRSLTYLAEFQGDVYKRQTMKRRVMEVLNQVGLAAKAGYYPDQLSGGEKRCV